jgi:hypothetical protein
MPKHERRSGWARGLRTLVFRLQSSGGAWIQLLVADSKEPAKSVDGSLCIRPIARFPVKIRIAAHLTAYYNSLPSDELLEQL